MCHTVPSTAEATREDCATPQNMPHDDDNDFPMETVPVGDWVKIRAIEFGINMSVAGLIWRYGGKYEKEFIPGCLLGALGFPLLSTVMIIRALF